MRHYLTLVAAFGSIGFLTFLFAADNGTRPLAQSVVLSSRKDSLSAYLLDIFRSAKSSGGIIISTNECDETREQFPEFSGSVESVLERLASSGYHINWADVENHLVVRNTGPLPTVLQTVVPEFRFSRKDPLTKVSSALFGSDPVRREIQKQDIVEHNPELGFAQTHEPSTANDLVTLSNVRVLDALNNIAGTHAVWLYRESQCDGKRLTLSWPVR